MSTNFVYKPRDKQLVEAKYEEYRQMDMASGNKPMPRLVKPKINVDTLDISQQENVMTLLAFNKEACLEIRNKVHALLFESEQYRTIVLRSIEYIDKYGTEFRIGKMSLCPRGGRYGAGRYTNLELIPCR